MKKVLTAGAAMAMVLSMASMGAMAEGDAVDVNVSLHSTVRTLQTGGQSL